jgi:hypothetical protein
MSRNRFGGTAFGNAMRIAGSEFAEFELGCAINPEPVNVH